MTPFRGVRTPRAGSLLLSVLCLFTLGCAESSGDSDGVGGLGGLGGADGSGGMADPGGMAGSDGTPEPEPKPTACAGELALFAVSVRDHEFGTGQDVGQDQFPELVLGPPHGAGKTSGSTDHVVSLGDGGFVELAFGDHAIVDGAGPDFIVFENAFFAGGDPSLPYAEFGQVSVSQDGAEWSGFPCQTEDLPYDSCAGWHPVLANPDTNELDPTDPEVAGGDSFDLAALGLDWARYVRIDDLTDDKQLTFDLDAVAVVHPGCF